MVGVDVQALSDLCTPWCIRVAVTLRIAERVAAGVDEIGALAREAECDEHVLHHVLGHLAGKGIFREEPLGHFALNDGARQLLDQGAYLSLDGIGGRFAHAWGTLLSFTRTGVPGYADRFGRSFWDDLAAHPDLAAEFDDLMGPAGHGVPVVDAPITGGWQAVRTVVDVGGGTGAMLAELLKAYPHLYGTLVDLPATVGRAEESLAGVADRATTVGQSFFDPLPPGADVYLLRKVLNDWPDRETVAILHRCAEAARPDGRVVVLGGVSADDAPRRLMIEMVLLGGKADTFGDFAELASRAGLEVSATWTQPSGGFGVECRAVSPE